MVRITCEDGPDGSSTITVEGRLVAEAASELARVAERAASRGGLVRLKLSGLTFADESGIALLQRLRDRDVALDGASVFLHSAIYGG